MNAFQLQVTLNLDTNNKVFKELKNKMNEAFSESILSTNVQHNINFDWVKFNIINNPALFVEINNKFI